MNALARRRGHGYDDLIDDFFAIPMKSIFGNVLEESNSLRVNVKEEDDKYLLRAEVPGLSKDDIDLNFEEGRVVLSAKWKEEGENHLRTGTYQWSRTFTDIDVEKAEASLSDGILKVALPKSDAAKPRRISIK